ncbi:MAG: DEAD/DEAH box helicase [Phycicoccus sp.]
MTFTSRLAKASGDPDAALDVFLEWAGERGFALYPAQEEAVLALASGTHVVLATPTGSGKSLVAVAAHAQALAAGRRSWYTAPIKALVSEKFFALVEIFGAEQVGMLTGDAAVNPGAPIICATAEVLANHALRERDATDIDIVVMDEFHFYTEPDRGWAWQVPLLLMPGAQLLLMSATLGDTRPLERDLTRRTGRETVAVSGAERPVPLTFEWVLTSVHETIELLLRDDRAPVYVVSFTQAGAVEQAQALTSVEVVSAQRKAAIKEAVGGFRFGPGFGQALRRLVLHGIGVHHAGMLPKYRRLIETLAQAGLLAVVCGTDTLGVGINVPIRTVLLTSLTKYDGRRQRVLRAREFHQIAGRAGRAGFDTAGYVVVQAPEHVIENSKLVAKAGNDPKKLRKVVRRKPPEGTLSWSESTYERLVASPPEPLVSRMRVSHAMVLNVLDQWEGQQRALHTLVLDNHEDDARREALVERAVQVLGSLLRAGVVEPDDGSTLDDWLPPEAPQPVEPAADGGHGVDPQERRPHVDAVDAPGRHGAEAPTESDDGAPLGALGHLLAEAGLAPDAPSPVDATPTDEAGVVEEVPEAGRLEAFVRGTGRRYADGPFQVAMDLHEGFALNQPLSAFALAALDLLDLDDPGYALDIVSVIEATLDDPRPVLLAQQFEARGEAVAAMKADGLDYEERMEALDDVTWPRPLADLLEHALRTYRQSHPWVDPTDLSPKSVVRELYERAMTFGEFTAHHKLARAEGVVLRYLTDAYRALRSTVPERARTDELDDLVEWLGEVVRHTDSSLLDEWEALMNPDAAAVTDVRAPTEGRALSANPRALRVMVRQSMFRRVELLDLGRYSALAALDGGLTEEQWEDAHAGYRAEYGEIGTGPAARGPALFVVDDDQADHPGEWHVVQVLDDPESDHDWRITATLDLAATDDAGVPVLVVTALAPS